jgi:hypothetical protein
MLEVDEKDPIFTEHKAKKQDNNYELLSCFCCNIQLTKLFN